MTLREAMRRPLTKPAIRKLEILEPWTFVGSDLKTPRGVILKEQWFVLTPDENGAAATAVPSFQAGLELLPVLGR